MTLPPILQVGDVLLSSDCLTECFCCDLSECRGACCVEGDAGAPVTLDEIALIEEQLDTVWPQLSAQAQAVIDRQGVAYTDQEGELVTSIVNGKDCVFASQSTLESDTLPTTDSTATKTQKSQKEETGKITLCTLELAFRHAKKTGNSCRFCKPASCALYPIREKQFSKGLVGLNYHQWSICAPARCKGKALGLRVYQFLKKPLVQRFGQEWYDELEQLVTALRAEGYTL